jgi:hypothetical protein
VYFHLANYIYYKLYRTLTSTQKKFFFDSDLKQGMVLYWERTGISYVTFGERLRLQRDVVFTRQRMFEHGGFTAAKSLMPFMRF